MDVWKSESGQRKRKKLKRKNTTKYDTIAPRDDVNVIFPIDCNFPIVSTLLSKTENYFPQYFPAMFPLENCFLAFTFYMICASTAKHSFPPIFHQVLAFPRWLFVRVDYYEVKFCQKETNRQKYPFFKIPQSNKKLFCIYSDGFRKKLNLVPSYVFLIDYRKN